MPCRLPDLGTVEADVSEGAVVELGELPNGAPVTPPRGESPDHGREVHLSSFHDEGADAALSTTFVVIAAQ
jgi:hypothetical protein